MSPRAVLDPRIRARDRARTLATLSTSVECSTVSLSGQSERGRDISHCDTEIFVHSCIRQLLNFLEVCIKCIL